MENLSLGKWRAGSRSVGGWISLTDLHAVEVLARMGFDWLCFDLQHGLLSMADLPARIAAIGATRTTPIVRVIANDAGEIGRALDAGAHGVIVPLVNTAEEAARAAAACRYPPTGRRSCGPLRGAMLEGAAYLATANDEVACIAMIETAEGLANVGAIARTPGLDALFVGPMDLCFGLGITPGAFADPRYGAALTTIAEAAADAGIIAGLYGYTAELARTALDAGFTFASIGTDLGFLRAGAGAALGTAGDASAAPRY